MVVFLLVFLFSAIISSHKVSATVSKWETHRSATTVDSVPVVTSNANMSETAQDGGTDETTSQVTWGTTAGTYIFKPGATNTTTGTPGTAPAGFGWWTTNPYLGTSASANWTIKVRKTDNRNASTCNLRLQVFYNTTRSVTGATRLFNSGNLATDLCTGTTATVSLTYNPGALNLTTLAPTGTAKYLLFEYWITTTAGVAGSNISFNVDGTSDNSVSPEAANTFVMGANITGTLYSDQGVTAITTAPTMAVMRNGTVCTSCTASAAASGVYMVAVQTPAAADTITSYINNNATYKGSLVTKYNPANTATDGKNMTGQDIYQNRVIARGTAAGNVTNTDMAIWNDPNDTDMLETSNTSSFTCRGASFTGLCVDVGAELYVWPSSTFVPGGNVTADDVEMAGTYTGGSETLTISGSGTGACTTAPGTTRPLCVTGTFTPSSDTVIYTGTAASQIEATTYNNLSLQPVGTPTYTLGTAAAQTININGNLVVGTGANNLVVNCSTNNPTLNLSGNLTLNASSTWTKSASATLTFNGTNTPVTWTDSNTTKQDLGLVAINGTSKTVNLGSSVTAQTVNVATGQTLGLASAGYTLTLTGSGTGAARPFIKTGTLSEGTNSTVAFTGTSATEIEPATYYNLTLAPAATVTYTLLSGTLATDNNLSIGNGTNAVTVTAATNNPTVNVGGSISINAAAILTASNSASFTVGTSWTNNGTFNAGTGTVTFNTTNTATIAGTTTFNNFTAVTAAKQINFTAGTTTTFAATGTLTVTGATGNEIKLYSTATPTQWNIKVLGARNVTKADIKDGGCASGTLNITTIDSLNSGNNGTCWLFIHSPNAPTTLVQKRVTAGTTMNVGDWTNETQVQFTATVSDPDNPDTLQLCVEKKPIATGFVNTEDSCGTGVSYTGTGLTATLTITGLVDTTEYHWQARVKDAAGNYSAWVSYGGNAETARDFGIDTTAPTGLTVYDGTTTNVDSLFNDGSLSALSANWSGLDATVSGLLRYDYSIGTSAGATDVLTWTSNGTATTVTASGLTLQSSLQYFINVRATDNANNTAIFSSNGQRILPTLSFSLSSGSITFANLNNGNSFTDTKTTTITTSTNAYNGYVVRLFKTDVLRSSIYPSDTIGDFNGGTYASPAAWGSGNTGFGYTSSDTTIQGVNKFSPATCAGGGAPPCFAPFASSGPGDIVADHTATVSGTPISNEQFTITYKVQTPVTQPAGPYSTTLVYTIIPQY